MPPKNKKPEMRDLYREVTAKILAELIAGAMPWRQSVQAAE
jgi:antirestriction protein ArdC